MGGVGAGGGAAGETAGGAAAGAAVELEPALVTRSAAKVMRKQTPTRASSASEAAAPLPAELV
ncbi:hypothetical protein GCM10007973_22050 [Polymorphobacter multimanifer]|nr:hypothetical protein GCM10007973_22050 [Polymorphobacter multimanifer]